MIFNPDFDFNFNFIQSFKEHMTMELTSMSVNQLTDLGNRAIELKLISAHGYHRGQYEILRQGEFTLYSPQDAIEYLQDLIEAAEPQ